MILDMAEILAYLGLGSTATDAERGLLNMIQPAVERAVKRYLGYSVEQATYTQYLPRDEAQSFAEPDVRFYDVINGRAVAASASSVKEARRLILPEIPVRSVTSVHEDTAAYAGQGASDFATATLLTAGTDYYVDYREAGMCRSGLLLRIGGYWSTRIGTIKVVYVAGWTQTELSVGDGADIKLACLEGIQAEFAKRGTGQGEVANERLGDYSVAYVTSGKSMALPRSAKKRLQPLVHYGRFF